MDRLFLALESLKKIIFLGNSAYQYLIVVLVFLATWLAIKLFERVIASKFSKVAKKTKNNADDVVLEVVNNVGSFFYFSVALFISFQWIEAVDWLDKVIKVIFILGVSREVINGIGRLVNFAFNKYIERIKKEDKDIDPQQARSIISMIRKTLIVVLWLVAGTFILANFGVNITSLVTGLGIGGVAVGFALQNILGDIFSSVSIFLDKPFKVGDVIQVEGTMGEVTKIGIKTTRITTLRGEELVMPNTKLTSNRIQNFSRLEKFREDTTLGVSYLTTEEQLKEIPNIIKNIVDKIDRIELNRCTLDSYGDSAIKFNLVFYVLISSPKFFDEKKEELNLKIYERFNEEGIEMPFPTRTVHLQSEEN